ncbi:MAG: hypothetical protein C0591_01515 [Marinilabiliales bacterium]|nr:MAG: hypothetical protein C0591_01515 [Marinilabiliales bacterium]
MNISQILNRVSNFIAILLTLLLIYSCTCRKDKIDVNEGRVLYDAELKVIPYKEGDTLRFASNNEIHEFICSYREHYYDKGQPTSISHNPCEGKRLMSKDALSVTLKTDLTAYYYQNSKVDQEDSVPINLSVESDYFDDAFSKFRIGMRGPFYGGANLYLIDNQISYQEDDSPSHTSYPYYGFSYYETILINNVTYEKVICIENKHPLNDKIPYYYSKLYYNEEFGIIRLVRSDWIVYDLVGNE